MSFWKSANPSEGVTGPNTKPVPKRYVSKNELIDKQFMHVAYNDLKHIYWSVKNQVQYTSVTTLLHDYYEPFNSEMMSFLCAKRDVKKGFTDLSVGDRKAQLLKEWSEAGRLSTEERGSPIHAMLENMYLRKLTPKGVRELYRLKKGEEFDKYATHVYNLNLQRKDGIPIPEQLLFTDMYELAGQADLPIEFPKEIHVYDYKTNLDKSLNYEHDYRGNMYEPLQHLPSGDLLVYELQLNLYAFMLEALFKKPVTKMAIIHLKNEDEINLIELSDRRKEVIKLLEHYKQRLAA